MKKVRKYWFPRRNMCPASTWPVAGLTRRSMAPGARVRASVTPPIISPHPHDNVRHPVLFFFSPCLSCSHDDCPGRKSAINLWRTGAGSHAAGHVTHSTTAGQCGQLLLFFNEFIYFLRKKKKENPFLDFDRGSVTHSVTMTSIYFFSIVVGRFKTKKKMSWLLC